ncbi:hypothetical protein [Dyadobacter sp. CY312]|uniref:hypothetical protein n=1 Tax=Dyadobacter sp. CY312 TaxID=2907303 RepID=UPI001F2F22EE|nr:hypothetical protein [Dyadobacter sp. CY312]MCE7040179.1 hypothetical protein [Dyadobacter sp. CY312]
MGKELGAWVTITSVLLLTSVQTELRDPIKIVQTGLFTSYFLTAPNFRSDRPARPDKNHSDRTFHFLLLTSLLLLNLQTPE